MIIKLYRIVCVVNRQTTTRREREQKKKKRSDEYVICEKYGLPTGADGNIVYRSCRWVFWAKIVLWLNDNTEYGMYYENVNELEYEYDERNDGGRCLLTVPVPHFGSHALALQ